MPTLPENLCCSTCKTPLTLEQCERSWKGGKLYMRRRCRACRNAKSRAYNHTEKGKAGDRRARTRLSEKRRAGVGVAKFILGDSRSSDKKAGRDNDLDLAFVEECIAAACAYCGETSIRMTLDRTDNDLGHTKTNVVAACIRCNYTRRNMPLAAWKYLISGMREARKAGAFGDWTGRAR